MSAEYLEACKICHKTKLCVIKVQKAHHHGGTEYIKMKCKEAYKLVKNATKYAFHELISGDKPCRLYLDVDNTPNLDSLLGEIRLHVQNKIGLTLGDACVFSACGDGKYSYHVTWDTWFQRPWDVRNLLWGLPVDFQVYPNPGGVKTLRLPLSYKLTEQRLVRPLVPLYGECSLELFVKGTAAWGDVPSEVHKTGNLDGQPNSKRHKGYIPESVLGFIGNQVVGDVKGEAFVWNTSITQTLRNGICPFKQDKHRGNPQSLVLTSKGLTLRCYDSDCKGLRLGLCDNPDQKSWSVVDYPSLEGVQRERLKWATRRQGRVWFSARDLMLPQLVEGEGMMLDEMGEVPTVALGWAKEQYERGVGKDDQCPIWDFRVESQRLCGVFYLELYNWRLSAEEWDAFLKVHKPICGFDELKPKRNPVIVLHDTRLIQPWEVSQFLKNRDKVWLKKEENGGELSWVLNKKGEGEEFQEGDWGCMEYVNTSWPMHYLAIVVHRWIPRHYLEKAVSLKSNKYRVVFVLLGANCHKEE